jgi:serine/threonine protein kinase/Tfp pilus assembly protein PilF
MSAVVAAENSMNNERWQVIWDIFFAALEQPPGQRAAWLAERAGADEDLRREVEALLAAHDKPDTRLSRGPALSIGEEDVTHEAPATQDKLLGGRLGPYRIYRVIGEGGMGTVYEAEQVVPVRRRIALKVIKLGMDSREIVRRFETERQALALMNHPSIARFYDIGTTDDGRPFFVMEYVPGVSLTEYCDKRRLGVRDRLQLIVTLCDAVQHAHQKGVVHRDLKPTNVLIDTDSAVPLPKVIDFGIAKALGASVSDPTLVTSAGFAIGTPAYMSPEQATLGAVDVDTRSDVYSIAALLYELMVGEPPFRAITQRPSDYLDALRQIREQEPLRPSTHFSTLSDAQRSALAQCRSATLRELGGQLREIDWVVLKGLAKDRARRYATPSELAEDIKRFLAGQPVLARPPSTWYRSRKFVGRHRFGVTAVATICVLVLALAVTMTVQSLRLERALRSTERERLRAESISRFLVELLQLPDPYVSNGATLTVRQALDQGAAKIGAELANEPQVKATLLQTMGSVYRQLGLYGPSQSLLDQALALQNATGDDARGRGNTLTALGELKHNLGDYAAARRYFLSGLDTLRSAFGDDPDVAVTLDNLVNLYNDTGAYAEAEEAGSEALRIRRKVQGAESPGAAVSMQHLARVYQLTGRYAQADQVYAQALALLRRAGPDADPRMAEMLNHYGILLRITGEWKRAESMLREALDIYRRTLPPNHSYLAATLTNLSGVLILDGRPAEAEFAVEEANGIWRGAFGETNPLYLTGRYTLAQALIGQGRYGEAADLMRQVATVDRERDPGDARTHSTNDEVLGIAERELGHLAQAEALHRSALALRRAALGSEHADVGTSLMHLGITLTARGEYAEAETAITESLVLLVRTMGERQHRTLAARHALAALRSAQGRQGEAATLFRDVIAARRDVLGKDHPSLAESLAGLGETLCRNGSRADGRQALEEARHIFNARLGAEHPRSVKAVAALAACGSIAAGQ